MKYFALTLLVLASFSYADSSKITCSGQGQSLELTVQNQVTQVKTVQGTLISIDSQDNQIINMLVTTQVLKAGEYYRDKEVRIFQGYSEDPNLKLGFLISQVLDQDQKEVRFDINKFGQAQVELGQCQVTEVK